MKVLGKPHRPFNSLWICIIKETVRLEGQYHIISLASYFVQGSQLTNYGRPYNFLKLRMLQEYRIRIVADTLSCHIDTFQQYSV